VSTKLSENNEYKNGQKVIPAKIKKLISKREELKRNYKKIK